MVFYEIETFNTINCVPCAICISKLSKNFFKYNRVKTEKKYQNCLNDCFVFKVLDNNNERLDHVLYMI